METEKYENAFAVGRSALLLGHAAQELATVSPAGWPVREFLLRSTEGVPV